MSADHAHRETDPREANARFAHGAIATLEALGVRHAVVCPGSRCTPLVLALADAPRIAVHVVHDERSAAFIALGIGRATEFPALVVTTSGTATANLLPAIVEASVDHVPMLVCTADRPLEKVHSGANQTIPQAEMYGSFVRARYDLAAEASCELGRVHARVRDAFAASLGPAPGPVHVNARFRKPLEIGPRTADDHVDVEHVPTRVDLTHAACARILDRLAAANRGFVVVGALRTEEERDACRRLLARTPWPHHATLTSGLRARGDMETHGALTDLDAVLADDNARAAWLPDRVLWLGGPTVSARLPKVLRDHRVPVERIGAESRDAEDCATTVAAGSIASFVEALEARDAELPVSAVREPLARIADALDESLQSLPREARIARHVAQTMRAGEALFVANSSPVRDLDRYAETFGGARVFCNRGVSGIDGTLSAAYGVARATQHPVTVLCGDLAFLHDAGSLSSFDVSTRMRIVVVDNCGGGLFHRLPIATEESHREVFERCIVTPHSTDIAALASAYGATARRLEDGDGALQEALDRTPDRLEVLVVPSDHESETRDRRRHAEIVTRALTAAVHEAQP